MEDPEGLNRRTRQAFNAHNRLSSRIDAAWGKTAYAYDARDNLRRVTDAGGRLRQREPGGAYDYNAGGRTTEDGRLRYRYGAQGRLAEITRAATG